MYDTTMSEEIPPKPLKNPQRIEFNKLQSQAVFQAGKIQELSQKQIDLLASKIFDLTVQEKELKQKLNAIASEVKMLQTSIANLSDEAKNEYEETINLILQDFETPPPPWTANIILEKGRPVGVDLIRPT